MTMTVSESADAIVGRLVRACNRAEVETLVCEPSTRVRVKPERASARMAEVITLRPDADEALCWWWTSGEQICPAGDVAQVVKLITARALPAR